MSLGDPLLARRGKLIRVTRIVVFANWALLLLLMNLLDWDANPWLLYVVPAGFLLGGILFTVDAWIIWRTRRYWPDRTVWFWFVFDLLFGVGMLAVSAFLLVVFLKGGA